MTAAYHEAVSFPSVVSVTSDSPAARADVRVGDEILSINGVAPRDVLEYRMLVDSSPLELDIVRAGLELSVAVEKNPGEPIGIEVHSAVFDRVVTCDNHCPFCFIYQLPKGMRKSLYLKDDDYRLSFLYGNFTTLTRCTERDIERIVDERLSPLYVSIHATDPLVRSELLRNKRGAVSLRWLRVLLDAGIDVHGQIVVCPGINDGDVLADTLLGILDRFPEVRSVGIVPLGVSDHNREGSMRPHTAQESSEVIDIVERWAADARRILGRTLFFLSDEWYLNAGRPLPEFDEYGPFEQHENGVGMARTFEREVSQAIAGTTVTGKSSGKLIPVAVLDGGASTPGDLGSGESGPCSGAPRTAGTGSVASSGGASGFFQWVDGAPGEGYRSPRVEPTGDDVIAEADEVTLITGEYGAKVLDLVLDNLASVCAVPVNVLPIANRYFGGNTAVAGLLTGADIADGLAALDDDDAEAGRGPDHRRLFLLPDVTLSRGVFLDGKSIDELPKTVRVVATDGKSLVSTLRSIRPVR